MLYEIMNSINNFFIRSNETGTFEIVDDGIIGDFYNNYIVGQYICIKNSVLNDGVYKVLEINGNKLKLDAELITETSYICLLALAIPKSFLVLVSEIQAWQEKNGCNVGVESERIDDYSISFDTTNGGSWKGVFRGQLNSYRKMFGFKCNKCRWYEWQ